MVIDETNLKQTVYMYKCENSTLQIKGKVNSITLGTHTCHELWTEICEIFTKITLELSQNGQKPSF